MSKIDKVWACHNIFQEINLGSTKEVREACCRECMLTYLPGVRDSLAMHDPMFKIAFKTREIWDLTYKVFEMWQKSEVVGETKQIVPKKPTTSK